MEKEQINNFKIKLSNTIDTFNLFGSIILIILLIFVLINGLSYGLRLVNQASNDIPQQMFILGIIIAMVTVFGQWIWSRYELFCYLIERTHIPILNPIRVKGGNNNGSKKNRTGSRGKRGTRNNKKDSKN